MWLVKRVVELEVERVTERVVERVLGHQGHVLLPERLGPRRSVHLHRGAQQQPRELACQPHLDLASR